MIWLDICPKKIHKWSTSTWKDAQHHKPSGQSKSKPWDNTTYHLNTATTRTMRKTGHVRRPHLAQPIWYHEHLPFMAGSSCQCFLHCGWQHWRPRLAWDFILVTFANNPDTRRQSKKTKSLPLANLCTERKLIPEACLYLENPNLRSGYVQLCSV